MTEKRGALMGVMDQLAKLLPLLASDKAGEVANAASRIVHVLAKVRLDWHDLVEVLRQEPAAAATRNSSPFENDYEALVRLAASASYFLSSEGDVVADIMINGHRETWPLASAQYTQWLMHAFWKDKERLPKEAQLKEVTRLVKARTSFSDAQRHDVHLRVTEMDDKIYLDLCDDAWQAVEISTEGWRIVARPPVRFRRTKGMLPLPHPVHGGTIEELRPFVNLDDADFLLVVAFLLDMLRVGRPHPVLYLAGGEGTAKSTLTRVLGNLIDPHQLKLRGLPKVRDLFVAAHNQAIVCFDNISLITGELSDGLCRLSSGVGFAKRKNYTDDEEFGVVGAHPVILNGIENCIDRPDLADRAIVLNLPRVNSERRRSDSDFWAAFEAARPSILGAILDIAALGLANNNKPKAPQLSRVADFQRWAIACETAFSRPGGFQSAFAANISATVEGLIDSEPVAKAIGAFMLGRLIWHGTAAELLSELNRHDQTEARVSRLPTWPRDPARLSKALRAMQPTLAKGGIVVEFGKTLDRRRTRMVKLLSSETGTSNHRGRPDDVPHIAEAEVPRTEISTE